MITYNLGTVYTCSYHLNIFKLWFWRWLIDAKHVGFKKNTLRLESLTARALSFANLVTRARPEPWRISLMGRKCAQSLCMLMYIYICCIFTECYRIIHLITYIIFKCLRSWYNMIHINRLWSWARPSFVWNLEDVQRCPKIHLLHPRSSKMSTKLSATREWSQGTESIPTMSVQKGYLERLGKPW